MPDGLFASPRPVRAIASGWELDAQGVSNGLLRLRGREEDPTRIAAAPVPLVPGDWGLLQYGSFSLFFQFAHAAAQGRLLEMQRLRGAPQAAVIRGRDRVAHVP